MTAGTFEETEMECRVSSRVKEGAKRGVGGEADEREGNSAGTQRTGRCEASEREICPCAPLGYR